MGLLKGIDPLLTADLLHTLRSMGHGDRLCICDCNFPAAAVATKTTSKAHIMLTTDLPTALDAILSVLPLDFFVDSSFSHMSPETGVAMPPAGLMVAEACAQTVMKRCPGTSISFLERYQFYEEARDTFAVVQTLERRPYGNCILVKGAIGPDGEDLKP